MEKTSRIKINLVSKEFEIEGTEAFIETHSDKIERLFELLSTATRKGVAASMPFGNAQGTETEENTDSQLPQAFGEYLHIFPKTVSNTERILIAGHFAQQQSGDNSFTAVAASALLLDLGIKLSNANAFLKGNLDSGKVIQLSRGKFRVSPQGLEHLRSLTLSIE